MGYYVEYLVWFVTTGFAFEVIGSFETQQKKMSLSIANSVHSILSLRAARCQLLLVNVIAID